MAVKKLIERIEVGSGGAASIEFTSIPQDAAHLVLVISARSSLSSTLDTIYVSLNSSTTNFSGLRLTSSGNQPNGNSLTDGRFGLIPAASSSSAFGDIALTISNYTESQNKSMSSDGVRIDTSFGNVECSALLWSDTSAISTLSISPNSGNFVEYSSASLYKITRGGSGTVTTA